MWVWIILFIIVGTLLRIAGEKNDSSFIRDTGRVFLILATMISAFMLFYWCVESLIF